MVLKSIPNFENYLISKTGKIYSKKRKGTDGRFIKPLLVSNGYLIAQLWKNNIACPKLIHRLVLETFVGPCPDGMECCHNNGIKTDNRLENLRWGTKKENYKDRIKHKGAICGETSSNHKLIERDVRMIVYIWQTGLFTQSEIAAIYNVSQSHISFIITKRQWKHLWKLKG